MDLAELLAKREQTQHRVLEVKRPDEIPGRIHPLLNHLRASREANDMNSKTNRQLARSAERHEPDAAGQAWRHRDLSLAMLEYALRDVHHLVVRAAPEAANGEGYRGHPAQTGIQLGRPLFYFADDDVDTLLVGAESRVKAEVEVERFCGGGAFANLRMRETHSDDIEVRDIDGKLALKGAHRKLGEDEVATQLEVGADEANGDGHGQSILAGLIRVSWKQLRCL